MRTLTSIIALLLCIGSAGADVLTATVDPDGTGDYTTLNAAVDALETDITDGTGSDDTVVITCICTGGTADATAVTFGSGWKCDVDNTITVTVDADYRHNGTYQTGNKYRIELASGTGIDFVNGGTYYVKLEGLQMSGAMLYGISMRYAYDLEITQCVLTGMGNGIRSNGGAATNSVYHKISNCIIYDCSTNGISSTNIGSAGRNTILYNITIHNCPTGVNAPKTNDPDTYAKNVIVQDCSTACYVGTQWGTGTSYNCSDDSTEPGTSGQDGEVAFADEASNDFHLGAGDTVAMSNGTDLSADALYPITVDIDGDTRVAWDIGADEFTAAAGGQQIVIL